MQIVSLPNWTENQLWRLHPCFRPMSRVESSDAMCSCETLIGSCCNYTLMNSYVSLVWTVVQLRCNRCYLLGGPWIVLLMSCFSLPILLLHTYILLMYCLLFGLCIEMPSYVVYKGKAPGVYDNWEESQRQVTVSAVTVTKGTPLGRRPNLDMPAI